MAKGPLLLCLAVAAASLFAVCQSCSQGQEFITAFLPNYRHGRRKVHQLQLVLTARGSPAKVQIKVGSLKFSSQLTLSAEETRWVSLPARAQLWRSGGRANSAVRVSSSADISVVAFNRRPYSGDSAVVTPTSQLGVNYLVYTPEGNFNRMDKLLAIVNGNYPNQITFLPSAKVKNRIRWKRGKRLSVRLAPYETYLVRSKHILTGLQIKSKQPVAVLSGHQCISMRGPCQHMYEHLPPVSQLGKEYMVPSTTGYISRDWAIVVAAEDDTEVTMYKGGKTQKRTLRRTGNFLQMLVCNKDPMTVKGNKKLMVVFLSTNRPHDPIMIALLPSKKLASDWSVETLGGQISTAVIFSEREGANSVKVCMKAYCTSPKWNSFKSDGKWVWSNLPLGKEQNHVKVKGDTDMMVYIYGGSHRYGYATSGVCSKALLPPSPTQDPCDGMSCREKEACVKGACVHITTATCRAVGDPHYLTFDGRRFDFQGTCTYTMATVAKMDKGLIPFTVTTKNDHRGNRRVSFVRTVAVSIYGQAVIISRHKGQVQVNGELVYLPVSLSGGKILVRRSGSYAVLTADIGLTVKYDWNMRLYITVPSSYYRHVGGLCGNYNGDRRDDLPDPSGSHLSTVLKMVQSWKASDSDRFCHDHCGSHCHHCSKQQRAHYRQPKLCGLLTKEDGPFSACHSVVDPKMYEDNCVYDVCINKGAKQILCDNIKSYADACLSERIKLSPQWRMTAKCYLNCPAGSHYEACGSACPSSCSFLDIEKRCKSPCVEGCQCNTGLVLSGDRCIPKASCGCQHQGRYYQPGSTFWADNKCSSRCRCDPTTAKVSCTPVVCKAREHCALKGGVWDCYPLAFATCKGTGDPHYRTFDGRRYDFQGTCTYILSQTSEGSETDRVPFRALVQNENRGRNKAVAYTKSVSLTVYNYTISMSSDNPRKVLLNSQSINLPYATGDTKLTLFRRGYFCHVQTQFGLSLKFNWRSHISLTLPSTYSSAVSGLCGNYNGKAADDLEKPDKTLAKGPNDFGNSFKAGGDVGCTSNCPGGKCPVCELALALRYQEVRYCGIIADKEGPFRECHAKLAHTEFLGDCVFDLCAYKGHSSALCDSLAVFSTACQATGATVGRWRSQQFCPPSCGANSHYEICAPPCPLTCSGLAPPEGCVEDVPCSDGCVCDDGFMLSDDKCVPIAECGCQYQGQYYRTGQVFYPGGRCTSRCVCSANGEMKCDDSFTCSANEKCLLQGGVASCVPKSNGSCSVVGARTVRSFDGQMYPLWGDCVFLLSEVEEKEGSMATYSVALQQSTGKNDYVTRSVEFKVYDLEITLKPGFFWELMVDDIRANLPLSLADGKVQAYQSGSSIVIEADFGLRVTYDTVANVFLRLPSTYGGMPRGLCSNFNGKPSDDFGMANQKGGQLTKNFVARWIIKEETMSCKLGCGSSSCSNPDKNKNPKAKQDCDIIKATLGPFAGCHRAVPPLPHFKACVKEMTTDGGGHDVLCRHIQAYVSSCQSEGTSVASWRTDSFCPMSCPSGSHYELCPDTYSATCAYLVTPSRSPLCLEGCQCDIGLVFDGGRCVPAEGCGCYVDGQYYKAGVSIRRADCLERCKCVSGQLNCSITKCQQGEKCDIKDGIQECYKIDPCSEVKCRVKERCEVNEGKGECVPESKALCWAFGDPHFTTFDGWSYSFQGTCTYVLVNTTGEDVDLPEVTVLTKNELRGNLDGSFVRSTSIELQGHTFLIPSEQRGIVMVDGVKMVVPVFLEEGSISITESGIRGILQSDAGVVVTFDWSTLVMVSLSSSFYGNVGGLCGNYNGNKEDELSANPGAPFANVTMWASSWGVADGDPFCYHHCEGECPRCSAKDRKRFTGPEFCGILASKTGPFAGCHARLNTEELVSDCLYDVCVNDGRHAVLCNALTDYHAQCQEAGAVVLPWRELANCSLNCPANSQYKTCGTTCPETCSPKPKICTKTCVEGCFCDPGFVLSGEKCVVKEKGCGCNHDGHYHLPGEMFWADSECSTRCTCDGSTRKAVCTQTGCKANERCAVKDGVQDCFPLSFKTCSAQGDPHFRTFDGRKFDFQGNCIYLLSGVCSGAKGLEKFEISLENNNRGSNRVSYAKVVTLTVFGNTYILSKDYRGQVLVDGVATYIPFSSNLVQVHQRQKVVILETHFLKVSYDWLSSVQVKVATTYQSALCGLCGNFNGNPGDDFALANGKLASSATEFGVSHWLANSPGCSHECKDCAQPLPPGFKAPAFTALCNIIKDKDGPLRDCVHLLDSDQYHRDCVYDMMLTSGVKASACNIITNYVEECQRDGGKVENWRRNDFCWMQCPKNSVYSITASGCQTTCASSTPVADCTDPPTEGCVCNRGYVLSQDRCVRLAQCGCQFEGHYVPSGLKFYADAGCQRFCACSSGLISCSSKPCGWGTSCQVRNGSRGCYQGKKKSKVNIIRHIHGHIHRLVQHLFG